MVVSAKRLAQGASLLIFASICGVSAYSNHEGLTGTTLQRDATHTRLIQYGQGGPHWVTADQYLRWQLSWWVLAVLGLVFTGLVLANLRLSGRWPRRRTSPWDVQGVTSMGSKGWIGKLGVRSPARLAAIIGIVEGAMVATSIVFG
jgi:hypothetical protein